MNGAAAISLALCLGSLSLTAQAFGQAPTGPAVFHASPPNPGCPVAMRAEQEMGSGGTLAISKGARAVNAQQFHLTLTNSAFVDISGIKVTVHGFTEEVRNLPTYVAESDGPAATKNFDLKIAVRAQKDASTDLSLSGFTAVSLIDVDTVTYADGSKWKSSALNTCHFGLDRDMLISSR